MVRLFIHHHVSDYAAWREVYDSFGDAQREHGVRAEAAKAFFALQELKEAMQRSGVEGEPAFWLAAEA